MSESPARPPTDALPTPAVSTWQRLKERKVVQWTIAYIALAYGLLHAVEMVAHAFDWPNLVVRATTVLLAIGVPVAALLAWYHGDRGQQRVSGAELALLTVLLFIAGSVLWMLARTTEEHPPATETQPAVSATQPSTTSPAPAPAPRASVAVVPFANLTGEPEKEYFSDGMAEELINTLAGVPGLKVPARTSSFAYKGRNTDVRQIARDLAVSTVLEGSVRSAGERIRVTAQLVDGTTGYHMWSESYDRKFDNLFKVQEELAAAIVQALRVHMRADLPSAVLQGAPTQDLEAYELYLQARSMIDRAGAENLRAARVLLQKATARDPEFARAFAGIGRTHLAAFLTGSSRTPEELVEAERAALHALSLDRDLQEARFILAQIKAVRGNWLVARQELESARSLNDREPVIYNLLTPFLVNVGQTQLALQEAHKAYQLAPAQPGLSMNIAIAASIAGRDAEAIRYADQAVNLGYSSDVPVLPVIYSHAAYRSGDVAEAGARMLNVLPLQARESPAADGISLIYAALGDSSKRTAAIGALRELKGAALGVSANLMTMLTITWYTMLGALDDAYEVANELKRSDTVGYSLGGLWVPETRPFRQDPRFAALAQRLGLIEYWKQYGPPDNCKLHDDKLICH